MKNRGKEIENHKLKIHCHYMNFLHKPMEIRTD